MSQHENHRDWESWIDQQIRQAQERGEFDNLPGKGSPVDLTPNPYAQEQELAFKILRDAGFAPEWIELDKSIRGRLERARATLARALVWRSDRLAELATQSNQWSAAERKRILIGWEKAVVRFQEEITSINADIADLNLKVPSSRFQRTKIDTDRELARLEGRSRE